MAEHRELTGTEIEQVGRIVGPMIRVAQRPEFDKLGNDFSKAITAQTEQLTKEIREKTDGIAQRIARHETRIDNGESRITALERIAFRGLAVWGIVSAVTLVAIEFVKSWIFRK